MDRGLGKPLGNPLGLPMVSQGGADIGSVSFFAENPGSDYIPAVGGVFNKGDYPKLFQKIGFHPGFGPVTWARVADVTSVNANPSSTISFGAGDVGFLKTPTGIARSTDNFRTVSLVTPAAPSEVVASRNGTVILADTAVSPNFFRSVDNGLTFASAARPVNLTGRPSIATDHNGNWVVVRASGDRTRIWTSRDDGVSWSTKYDFTGPSSNTSNIASVTHVTGGVFLCATGAERVVLVTYDYGENWVKIGTWSPNSSGTGVLDNLRPIEGGPAISSLADGRVVMLIPSTSGQFSLRISYSSDLNLGFLTTGYAVANPRGMAIDEYGNIVYTSNSSTELAKNVDGTYIRFAKYVAPEIFTQLGYNKGEFIANGGNKTFAGVVTPTFDVASQFFVPTLSADSRAYIRAR